MRKPFLLSLLVAILTTLSTRAYDFQSGDLYYNITGENTVEVTYQYRSWERTNYQGLTTANIPETVTNNGTTYSVTSIGGSAFEDCSSLTSITLPNSVTSIGDRAFFSCSSLTSITIPNSVTSIGEAAFAYCSSLTSITIPNSVTSIGNYAFGGCSSLTSIVVESGNTMYDSRENCNAIIETATNTLIAGCQSTTIPNSVTSIGSDAFAYCSSLTSLTIPNSVTSIGESAFCWCSSLTSITIPNSVTSIGFYAFNGCSALTSITIPNSVTSIGYWAFNGCSALTSITIPNSVTSIGREAFEGCSSLTSIVVESGNTMYDSRENCNAIIETATNTLIAGCQSTTIPNSITSIGEYAFYGCSSLTSITLPNSVTSIGEGAFYNCSSLTSVTSLSCTPPSCGSNVFNGTPSEKTLVVPSISMDAYKNSSTWKEFTSFESIVYPSITLHSSDSTLGIAQIDQDVDCDSVAIISALANYGYHFKQWNDGNTDNPRTIKLTQDTTFTAEFAPNQYSLTTTTNYAERGTTQGDTIADYLTELQVSATANYGYHFTQWSDGNTNNPRTISLTKDTNLVALFEKNQYTITTTCNAEQGTISGTQVAEYLDEITLNVLPNVGWHFTQWNDGNTDNPRTFTLTQDTTFAAEFAMDYSGKCGDDLYWAYSNQEIKITGTGAMYNYTDSTMSWTLLRDSIKTVRVGNNATSIGAYAFAACSSLTSITIPNSVTSIGYEAFSGCSSLTSITLPNSVTSIGEGAFWNCSSLTSIVVESGNTMYDSRENCNAIIETASNTLIAGCQSTTIPNSVTSIGDYAFQNCSALTSITLPNSVTSIGEYAFSSCSSLADIYCYATTPPMCETNTFNGVSKHCRIHVPAGTLEAYQWAPVWGDFYHFYEISELPDGAPTDQVGVTVTGNYATFSWPVNPTASSYTLTITKDGEVFCTLIFNNMGQLVGMAFAPARNGEQSANQDDAQSTAYGFSFVVTNLDANSHYTYTFTVNGADNEVIETYSGAFDTSEVTALSETEQQNKPSRKIIRDGQVVILRNGETYDMMGQRM